MTHLVRLNTHAVGTLGLVGGGAAIVAAAAHFVAVLSSPPELVALYEAAKTHHDPAHAVAQLVGAAIATIGAIALALLAAYFGRPATIAADGGNAGAPADAMAAQSPPHPSNQPTNPKI